MVVALSPSVAAPYRSARWAVGVFFFVFGVFVATWVPHIPLAKERLDVSPGWFGAALLCMGGGGVGGMIPVRVLINRWGSARVLIWTACLASVCLPLLALAPSYWAFAAALGAFGAFAGMTDVAMNAHGMELEADVPPRSVRAPWPLRRGGARLGRRSLAPDRAPLRARADGAVHAPVRRRALVAGRFLLPADVDRGSTNKPLALPNRATFGLGLLALLALLIEGAVLDWAGIHLRATFAMDASLDVLPGVSLLRLHGSVAAERGRAPDAARIGARAAALGLAHGSLPGVCAPEPVGAPGTRPSSVLA